METVVVSKERLLSTLRENKEIHDNIFNVALSGYWIEAKRELKEKKNIFNESVRNMESRFDEGFLFAEAKVEKGKVTKYIDFDDSLKGFSSHLSVTYPENHSSSYETAIKKVDFSVYDEIKLSSQEFSCFIMNDWTWKSSFLNSNLRCLNLYSGACVPTEYSLDTTGAYGNYVLATSGADRF